MNEREQQLEEVKQLKKLVKEAYKEGLHDDKYTDADFVFRSWNTSKTKQTLEEI